VIGAFEWLLNTVVEHLVFKRDKIALGEKVYACILFLAGLSTRGMTERYGLVKRGVE
jgi:hypothetical protein